MSTVINTNINAIIAERNLTALSTQYQQSVERLSSGLRINRAADDAAGLAISQNLEAQVNGLNQAQSNAQDGMSMVQTAEGALNEVQAMLQRMSELSVEAANGTLGPSDLQSVASEMTALTAEIDRISKSTTFNGLGLLDGSLTGTVDTSSTASLEVNTLATSYIASTSNTISSSQQQALLNFTAGSTSAPNKWDAAISAIDVSGATANTTYTIATSTSSGGDDMLTLTDNSTNVAQTIDLTKATSATGATLDFSQLGVSVTLQAGNGTFSASQLATDLSGKNVVTGSNQAATLQIGASASDTLSVSFEQVDSTTLNIASAVSSFAASPTNDAANALITTFDNAINQVSTIRGNFGATENRLQHTVNSLSVASENLTASQSRIQDLDVAAEMVNFSKLQILQQAGVSVLAQANQSPSYVLKLLQ